MSGRKWADEAEMTLHLARSPGSFAGPLAGPVWSRPSLPFHNVNRDAPEILDQRLRIFDFASLEHSVGAEGRISVTKDHSISVIHVFSVLEVFLVSHKYLLERKYYKTRTEPGLQS